jgi:hypothetical protein
VIVRRHPVRARPGELVHIDVNKLGNIPDGGGWRVSWCEVRMFRFRPHWMVGSVGDRSGLLAARGLTG